MNNELCILCVEDVPADVAMLNHALRAGGMSFRSKRVETQEAFLHELEHNPPDVILSDHGLPAFDGFMALTLARERCPEVPFIFVTGKLGEQIAIETLRNGATDYVLKSNLAKLAPTIQRALRETAERAALKQKELQLRESEDRYRQLVEFCPAAFLVQRQGEIVFANRAAAHLLGAANARHLAGKSMREIIHPQSLPSLDARFNQLIQTGPIFFWRKIEKGMTGKPDESGDTIAFTEEKFIRQDGSAVEVEVAAAPLLFQGRPAIQIIARDISEHTQMAEQLRRSEKLKTAILETTLDAILSVDHQGKIQEWNRAAQRIFGYNREQAMGRLMDDLIVPASLLKVYSEGVCIHLINGVGSLLNRPIELTLRRADGSEFPAELAISRVPAEEPPRCTALVRDISERKRSETALRESEARYRMLVENATDYAIYLLDPAGRVTTWNAGAERIKGYNAEEIIGKPFAIFFTPEDVQGGVPEQLLKLAEKEGRAIYDGQCARKDGSRFWIQGVLMALRDEDGKLRCFSEIARDVTRQKAAEERMGRWLN